MAAAKYRSARFAMGAAVVAAVVGGTAYFADSAPGQTASEAQSSAAAAPTAVTVTPAGTKRVAPAAAAPARRSRGS